MLKHHLLESPPAEHSVWVGARRRRSRFISGCHGFWGVLAACIGFVGVLPGDPDRYSSSFNGMVVMFGCVLCGLVTSRFYWGVRCLPSPSRAELRELSRRDSRAIYLLLFSLVGVHLIGVLLHGASVSGTAGELKGYVAGGVCALLLTRCSGHVWLKTLQQRGQLGGA